MAEKIPPKTCSIERLITREDDLVRVASGTKTASRRNGRYADVGETFECHGKMFRITKVYRQRLSEMTENDFNREGFVNKRAYSKHLRNAHKGIPLPWIPMAKVWVHEFELQE